MTAQIVDHGLRDWILDHGHRNTDLGDFIAALGEKLNATGIPVYRISSGIPILHPLIRAESTLWVEGEGVSMRQFPQALAEDSMFTNSPLYNVYTRGETVRMAVSPTPEPGEYGILADLRAEGATDYIAFPLIFSDGSYKSMTLATRHPDGFSDGHIAQFDSILSPVAMVFEIHAHRRSATTLLSTYIGRRTAPRVLAGEIRRGDGQQIEAVIWFSDLRGFTDLSGRFGPRELVDVLDFYFEAMTEAVEARGGEILKFIGDAVLAIFTYANEHEAREAANSAVEAALGALEALEQINETEMSCCAGDLSVGISLHVGAVFYGNVGGRDRLDFTVIGEAVNVGSRLNGLTRDLGHPILASEDFIEYADHGFTEVGTYSLKGVRRPQRVYHPAPASALAARPLELAQSAISRP
ncbi:adenylate/guanylate cyclase domain-containing protein [Microbaculum marinisediminis]|uniref:Adenylate/guanylate cyclase domain-containing protein n=1 Tax=Microbaculum marinisediminis TaxID=2931392 RepID=A0AAW5R2E3_9HYPH|nr:adenylate/guanylate cyclase domain-containing protein [Microbaculum sp. A6E488]MCT8973302.1 adenylate/guanylate cyclase domain-containing protein [Microbaculum sp. A6E488]